MEIARSQRKSAIRPRNPPSATVVNATIGGAPSTNCSSMSLFSLMLLSRRDWTNILPARRRIPATNAIKTIGRFSVIAVFPSYCFIAWATSLRQ